jgi:hypothetical protein
MKEMAESTIQAKCKIMQEKANMRRMFISIITFLYGEVGGMNIWGGDISVATVMIKVPIVWERRAKKKR